MSESPPSRYRAEVVYVLDVDPSLRWWLDRHSPNFNVWNGVLKNESLYDVKDKMYGCSVEVCSLIKASRETAR